MPLHHLRINVTDLHRSKNFYEHILLWLGFHELEPHLALDGRTERYRFTKEGFIFLLSKSASTLEYDRNSVGLHHLAFAVPSRAHVDAFYKEVLLNLQDVIIENPPIECPEYRPGYYATFFFDPDGIKLEVTFSP